MRGLIRHNDYEVEYFVFGTGPETLIAFHGFNNNAWDFHDLGTICGNQYSVLAVNIFFHGSSRVQDRVISRGFSLKDLKDLFRDIYNILPTDKYTLMGYSLGGRICLKLFELYPDKIDRIILLAPDGIRVSRFYLFLTRTFAGRFILKKVIYRPEIFFIVARMLRKSGIVGEKKYQFAVNNFDNRHRREKVYQVWMTLRNVISKNSSIKSLLGRYDVHLFLFFGKYDRIIPSSIGRRFARGAENHVHFYELDEGHRMIRPDTLRKVMKIVNNQP